MIFIIKGFQTIVFIFIVISTCLGGARGVMVIIIGNGHKFKSWTRLIAFHIALIPLGKVWIQLFSLQGRLGSSALVKQLV